MGGNYEVIHHTTLQQLMDEGKIKLKEGGSFKGKKSLTTTAVTSAAPTIFMKHPCKVLEALDAELVEMKRCKSNGLCCGAGGAQMFKEEEKWQQPNQYRPQQRGHLHGV